MRERTINDKVSDWFTVFKAVEAELTPQALREMTSLVQARTADGALDIAAVQLGMRITGVVTANDRAAAVVAAILTAQGVKPLPLEVIEADATP